MFYLKYIIFAKIIINVNALTAHPNKNISVLMPTEEIIRNTLNKIFVTMKFKNVNDKVRKRKNSIHNFFTKLSLKEHKALQDISAVTKVGKFDNTSESLINIINEITDDLDDSITYNINVLTFIERFLNTQSFRDAEDVVGNFSTSFSFDDMLDMDSDLEEGKDNDDDENEFWVPSQETRRIYKGDRTKIKYFPFMASVHIFKNFQCGGSIIHSDLIVTAASCLQLAHNNRFFRENPAFLSVRVGSTYVSTSGEDVPVIEVYFHPNYDPKTLNNNISVMRLRRHLSFKHTRVKKINFDRESNPLPYNTPGVTIIGWGARSLTNVLDNPFNNRIAFSVLDIYPLNDCQDVYTREYVTRNNFCAGFLSRGSGACNKDAGDPGVIEGKLYGIVSFGSPTCGSPDSPTVFTRVGYYSDWIEEIIDMSVPQIKVRTSTTLRLPFTIPLSKVKTTFKIAPIGGPMKPVPVNGDTETETRTLKEPQNNVSEQNSLRELKEKMFQQMIGKLINRSKKHSIPTESDEAVKTTQVVQLQPIVTPEHKYTVIDIPTTLNSDGDIIEAIENFDEDSTKELNIESIVDKTTLLEQSENKKVTKKMHKELQSDRIINLIRDKNKKKRGPKSDSTNKDNLDNTDDAILTLLYLSDNENYLKNNYNSGELEDFSEETGEIHEKSSTEGMNILLNDDDYSSYHTRETSSEIDSKEHTGLDVDVEGFQDLTFRNNDTMDFFDLLPKEELYDLLSDALSATSNKEESI